MGGARLWFAAAAIAVCCLILQYAAMRAGWLHHELPPAGVNMALWGAAFVAGWTLMTGAMTLPSAVPFLRSVDLTGGPAAMVTAAAGFNAIWIALGVVFWAGLWIASGALASLPPGGVERLAAVTLLVAAAYQVSPLSRACQRLCAQPFAILARHWHGAETRRRDAMHAGLHYGVSCVGCCVPMIVMMFLGGMNDLRWVFGLGLLMIAEKNPVWGARLALPVAIGLASAGLAIGAGWWTPPLSSIRILCVEPQTP